MKSTFAAIQLGVLAVGLLTLTGCATPALWSKKYYHPADNVNLALALGQDGKDILVSYDESCGKSQNIRRRSYWLFASTTNADGRTIVAKSAVSTKLSPIPVIDIAKTNSAPARGYCAFTEINSNGFRLCRDGQTVGNYGLPLYDGAPPVTWWRVVLTPVAAAADAGIVGILRLDPDQIDGLKQEWR